MNGYTESDAKVNARMERRAMLNQMALAELWAAEQQRVNAVAREAVQSTNDPQIVKGVSSPEWFAAQKEREY